MPARPDPTRRRLLSAAALVLPAPASAAFPSPRAASDSPPATPAAPATAPDSAAPFVATPWSIVDEILGLAQVGPGDFLIDLGSGDGRLVIAAVARYGAHGGYGVEIDPALVRLSNAAAAQAGVADRVRFDERDLFTTDVHAATVVTVYLLPRVMARLQRKLLAELAPGTRVVVNDYPFPTWQPERVVERESVDKLAISGMTLTQLFLYRVPERR